MSRIKILNSEISSLVLSHLNGSCQIIDTIKNINDCDILALYDYHGGLPEKIFENTKVLNLHLSLLPAFKTENPLKDTFTSGVKVGGITIHYAEKDNFFGKIIAQYPVLIGNTTHFDEYCNEIKSISSSLYPVVIEAVANDRVFDFSDLFNSRGCSGGCSGNCNGCKH